MPACLLHVATASASQRQSPERIDASRERFHPQATALSPAGSSSPLQATAPLHFFASRPTEAPTRPSLPPLFCCTTWSQTSKRKGYLYLCEVLFLRFLSCLCPCVSSVCVFSKAHTCTTASLCMCVLRACCCVPISYHVIAPFRHAWPQPETSRKGWWGQPLP
jgi:hypothetical protein